MRKTHSYLKGLAETRARLDGDIKRYEMLTMQIAQELEKARQELAACDMLIRKFDPRLRPERIVPVTTGHAARGGKRGALRDTIIQVLKEYAPEMLTTLELSWQVGLKLGINFSTDEEFSRWSMNSVKKQLQRFVAAGRVERLHTTAPSYEVGRWRWAVQSDDALQQLTAVLEASGLQTHAEDTGSC